MSVLISLLLMTACGTCDELDIHDPDDRLSAELKADLRQAHSDWRAWTGRDDICLDKVVPRDWDEGTWLVRVGKLRVDPDMESAQYPVFWSLCQELERREGHAELAPELFGDDARHEFVDVCSWGPWDPEWRAQVVSACGTDELSERDRYIATEIYPYGPAGRMDGALEVEEGELQEASDGSAVQLGEALLIADHDGERRTRASLRLLDPVSGEERELWAEGGGLGLQPYGGLDAAAVLVERPDRSTAADRRFLLVVEADGTLSKVLLSDTELGYVGEGTVGHGALWLETGWLSTAPLLRIDLESGTRSELALPAAPEGQETLLSGIHALHDGIYIEVLTAVVDIESGGFDFVASIGISEYQVWRYRPDDDSWTLLTTDLNLQGVGVDTRGRVVGGVFSEAGRVLAAYDPDTDALLIDDSICLDGNDPVLAAGDMMWQWVYNGDEDDEVQWLTQALHLR